VRYIAIVDLRKYLKSKKCSLKGKNLESHHQVLQFMRFQRMGLYKPIWNKPRKEIALLVAASAEKGRRVAERIQRDERKWIQSRGIILQKKREQASILSKMNEEETQLAIREYIAGAGDSVSATGLAHAITQYWSTGQLPPPEPLGQRNLISPSLHPPDQAALEAGIQKILSTRTASRWLNKLGYRYKECRKGVYKDGHERPDVISYRQDHFLPTLSRLKPFMVQWQIDENGKPIMVYPQDLPPGQRPIVLITHDESTFEANDSRRYIWMKEGEPPIRRKGRGKGIMVSHFVSAGGHLKAPDWIPIGDLPTFGMTEEPNLHYSPYTATMKLEYGGNKWWVGEDLVQQVTNVAIPIFETAFSGCQALFLFDNATSHAAFASDALRAKSMSLRPGGTQSKLDPEFNPATGEIQ